MKVLLTTTSFQDTPGKHQTLFESQNFDIHKLRGPITEIELLPIIADYDAVICGDDEYTENVIRKGAEGKLKYISKYGVGLDKIDLKAAAKYNIPVTNCPGVNQVSVAEHVIALLFCFSRSIHLEHNITTKGGWYRYVGNEVQGKTIGVFGLGSVGKEVAKKAKALGMNVKVADKFLDQIFVEEYEFEVCNSIDEMLSSVDVISLHTPHTPETEEMINSDRINQVVKKGLIIINTARGKLVNNDAILEGLEKGIIGGYLTDVLEIEPMPKNHPLQGVKNVIITPHIGSRTYQSVERQGLMAVENLLGLIKNNLH
jgi:D-3-phosphoglycerate dehydrogenase